MRSIIAFVKGEVWAVALILAGGAIFVFNAVSGALQLLAWGIPGWGWQIIATVFVVSGVLVIAYRLHQRLEALQSHRRTPPPEPGPKPLPAAASRQNDASWQGAHSVARWARVGSFELYQAACLWAGETPPSTPLLVVSEDARANLAMLKAAILDGELESIAPTGLAASMAGINGPQARDDTRVTRDSLLEFAKLRGERPAFLFPLTLRRAGVSAAASRPKRTPDKMAALWLEDPKFSFHKTNDGRFEKGMMTVSVKNVCLKELRDCQIIVTLSEGGDGADLLEYAPHPTGPKQRLRPGASYSVNLLTRDLADIINRPPWLLHLDGRRVPLLPGKVTLHLALTSEYDRPTHLLLDLWLGEENDVSVTLRDQGVSPLASDIGAAGPP